MLEARNRLAQVDPIGRFEHLWTLIHQRVFSEGCECQIPSVSMPTGNSGESSRRTFQQIAQFSPAIGEALGDDLAEQTSVDIAFQIRQSIDWSEPDQTRLDAGLG